MKVLIITGGNIDDDFAFSFLKNEKYDEIIAVDGGLSFVDRMNQRFNGSEFLKISHLVGDFDTIAPEILEKYIYREDICVHAYVPEKDYTDTDIAVKLALTLFEKEKSVPSGDENEGLIHILGGTGTRMDHVMANMQMLKNILEKGIRGVIIDKNNAIEMIQGRCDLKRDNIFGKYMSLIPASMKLLGITLKGFKYPLCNAETCFGESLCVSNELIEDEGHIEIKEGMAWMILSRD